MPSREHSGEANSLKNDSTLRKENTLEKRGRVNKDISCANPPPRSLDVMADPRCTGQTMIFSFSPFHFPFTEMQCRILREQAYLFIYAFSALLIKEMRFSPSSLCSGEAVGIQ